MAPGKHSLHSYNSTYEDMEEEISKRKIFIIIGIIIVLVAIVAFAIICVRNSESVDKEKINDNTVTDETVKDQMIATYQGYDVLGKIVIEDFDVEQYILDSKEDKALECGVTKLYGGTLNNYGNFCIAGHNKDGVFGKLSEMEVGDNFSIIEPDLKETVYKITEIYSTEADDLKCLLQNEEKIEITLVTCENASTTRLIVKAEEVIEN